MSSRTKGPTNPCRLPRGAWLHALRRTPVVFVKGNMTDSAAALTYYAVFSIFPALIALVSTLSLVGASASDPILENLRESPGTTSDVLTNVVEEQTRTGGGLVFAIGIAAALWAASGYVGAFGRASNAIYGVEEGRPFWRLRPIQFALTAVLLILVGASAVASVLSGAIAKEVGDTFGVGAQAVETWDKAKLPAILILAAVVIALLFYVSPNVRRPGFSWVLTGGGLALLVFLLASAMLAYYFAHFANYNKTYGALAGVIAFLFWLWVTNLALLLGQTFNAELERQRHIALGIIGPDEPAEFVPKMQAGG